MVALYTARICEFFVKRLCSGLWSGSFSVFPPPSHPYFSSFHCFISVTGAWNGGSWLGCGDLPATGAVFYLGAGWPQWKPLGIPGTHLPLKWGSWPLVFLSISVCLLLFFFSKLLYRFAFKLNQSQWSQSNESSMMHLNILPEQYTVFRFDSNPLFGVKQCIDC